MKVKNSAIAMADLFEGQKDEKAEDNSGSIAKVFSRKRDVLSE